MPFSHLHIRIVQPTPEEREKATNGKWERDGQFKFSFELRK